MSRRWAALGAVSLAGLLVGCESPPVMRPTPVPPPAARSAAPAAEASPARRLLQSSALAAETSGAGPMRVAASELAAEGDRVGTFQDPPASGCLLAIARGADSIEDIDLLAFSDEGTPLAVDEAQDATPALLLCPPHPGRVYLMARVMSGRGLVALGTHEVPLEVALRVGKALNARGRPGASGREAETWPGLDDKAAAARRVAGGQWREARRVAVPAEARAPGVLTETLEADRCVLLLATPSDDTTEIDAQVLDSEGRVVGRSHELGRDRLSVVCSSVPTSLSVELRPRIGAGLVAVVIARSVAGSEPDVQVRVDRLDLFPTGTAEAALARLTSAGLGAPTERGKGTARSGARAAQTVRLPAGCARLDVAAGAPAAGLLVELWSPRGEALGRVEGRSLATLFACGPGGPARLEIEAQQRPGPFAFELRSEPAEALLHGLAGGRLLTRLSASGAPVRARELQGAQRLSLTSTQRGSADYTLPAGRCLEIGAALEPGGAGLDLRLLDASTQEDLGHATGTWSAATRACASSSPLHITAQAQVLSGRADAVIAAHFLSATP